MVNLVHYRAHDEMVEPAKRDGDVRVLEIFQDEWSCNNGCVDPNNGRVVKGGFGQISSNSHGNTNQYPSYIANQHQVDGVTTVVGEGAEGCCGVMNFVKLPQKWDSMLAPMSHKSTQIAHQQHDKGKANRGPSSGNGKTWSPECCEHCPLYKHTNSLGVHLKAQEQSDGIDLIEDCNDGVIKKLTGLVNLGGKHVGEGCADG